MGSFQDIEASAQKIIEICGKSQLKKSDKDRLLKIQAEMHASIENLLECELCSCINNLLVEIKISGVSAKTCRDCGIKALEAGEIKKTPSRRRSSTTYNSTTGAKRTNNTKSEKKSLPEIHTEIENRTNLKKTEIRKIQKLIDEIPTPMNLTNTIDYISREVEIAKLKIDSDALKVAIKLIMA
ncbi:MAG: hypothetical protein VX677_12235 [Candidatus Poribacteria bacterium]|nr:hypothetical protein [Candidatus Poribacteria bacterium]